jgi:hypothetical protein
LLTLRRTGSNASIKKITRCSFAWGSRRLGLEEALLLAGVLHLVDPSPFLEKAPHMLAGGHPLKFDYPADQGRSLRVVRLERLGARRTNESSQL